MPENTILLWLYIHTGYPFSSASPQKFILRHFQIRILRIVTVIGVLIALNVAARIVVARVMSKIKIST